MKAEARLKELGLLLPKPLQTPPGIVLPFPWVHVRGDRAFVSGHGPQDADGSLAGPFGKVGDTISIEQGREIARKVGLSMLGSLKRELGSLDRITGWCRVFGMVNCAPGFDRPPTVINGFSELILDVFGPEIGRHARSAIGVAGLPFNIAVEVEAEVAISV
ncbi:RidA family protein [Microvirga roseola]|uniref:RidA family protein n=1 Tax=Microvirga roseola TaxID=2883126 RepID=UPI001E3285EE|nr:RidA family protein [Microvirga roseola]